MANFKLQSTSYEWMVIDHTGLKLKSDEKTFKIESVGFLFKLK